MLQNMGDLEIEARIVSIFRSRVQGQNINTGIALPHHDGSRGHILESLFGIPANSSNSPDLFGYELKSDARTKTTFGDWSADWYLFSKKVGVLTRHDFLKTFGAANPSKNGRFSWSGKCFPKVGQWNEFGQTMIVLEDDSVAIKYSFEKDNRSDKHILTPTQLQKPELTLAFWSKEGLSQKLNRKFNQKGWLKVLTDDSGTCISLAFGEPISFEKWIGDVRTGKIYLDSGMYDGNPRPYQNWRANNDYWENLIVRRYQ
jgi:hypothetical protein